MVSPLPLWNSRPKPFALYCPTEAEVDQLTKELESITNKNFDNDFKESLKRIITLTRHQADSIGLSPNKADITEEFRRIKEAAKKGNVIIDKASSNLRKIIDTAQIQLGLAYGVAPSYKLSTLNAYQVINILAPAVDQTIDNLTNAGHFLQKTKVQHGAWLAHLLNEYGVKPNSSVEGKLEKCLEKSLESIKCEVEGREIKTPPAADLHRTVLDVIKLYKTTEKSSLIAPDSPLFSF